MMYNILPIYYIKTISLIIINSSSNVNSSDSHWRCFVLCWGRTMVGAASQNSKTIRRLKISDRLLYHFWICLSILHCMHFETTLNCKYLEIQLCSLHIIFIWTQNSNNLKTVKNWAIFDKSLLLVLLESKIPYLVLAVWGQFRVLSRLFLFNKIDR